MGAVVPRCTRISQHMGVHVTACGRMCLQPGHVHVRMVMWVVCVHSVHPPVHAAAWHNVRCGLRACSATDPCTAPLPKCSPLPPPPPPVNQAEIESLYKRVRSLDRGRKGYISADEFLAIPELSINPVAQRLVRLFECCNFKVGGSPTGPVAREGGRGGGRAGRQHAQRRPGGRAFTGVQCTYAAGLALAPAPRPSPSCRTLPSCWLPSAPAPRGTTSWPTCSWCMTWTETVRAQGTHRSLWAVRGVLRTHAVYSRCAVRIASALRFLDSLSLSLGPLPHLPPLPCQAPSHGTTWSSCSSSWRAAASARTTCR